VGTAGVAPCAPATLVRVSGGSSRGRAWSWPAGPDRGRGAQGGRGHAGHFAACWSPVARPLVVWGPAV